MGLRFTIAAPLFAEAVAGAARRAPVRAAQPILACVRLAASGGGLWVSAFDHEVAVTYPLVPDVVSDGVAVVSAKLLADLVKTFGGAVVEGEVESARLVLRAGRVKVSLPLAPAEDYPRLPDLPSAVGVVDGDDLAVSLKRVNVSVDRSGKTGVVALSGIFLECSPDGVRVMATDRYQAAIAAVDWRAKVSEPVQVLVHASALMDAAEMFAGRGDVQVCVAGARVGFEAAGRMLVGAAMLAEPVHPEMPGLFPPESVSPAVVDAAVLKRHVETVALINGDDVLPVVLTFAAGELCVRARGEVEERSGAATMDCDYGGEALTIGFQPRRLLAALSAVRAASVACHLSGPSRPMMVVGVGEPAGAYRHLLMPVSPRHF